MLHPIYLHYKALYLTIRRCQKAPSFFPLCDRQSASQSGESLLRDAVCVTGATAWFSKHRSGRFMWHRPGLLTIGLESAISPSVVPRRIVLIGPIRPLGPMRCGTPRVFGPMREWEQGADESPPLGRHGLEMRGQGSESEVGEVSPRMKHG